MHQIFADPEFTRYAEGTIPSEGKVYARINNGEVFNNSWSVNDLEINIGSSVRLYWDRDFENVNIPTSVLDGTVIELTLNSPFSQNVDNVNKVFTMPN